MLNWFGSYKDLYVKLRYGSEKQQSDVEDDVEISEPIKTITKLISEDTERFEIKYAYPNWSKCCCLIGLTFNT